MGRARAAYDLAVVGGGIVGVLTALLAARRNPERTVLLLDRGLFGAGATAYSAFLDFPYGITEPIRVLSRRSMEIYAELRSSIADLPIVDVPMHVVASAGRFEAIRSRFTGDLGALGQQLRGVPRGFRIPMGQDVLGIIPATRCVDDGLVRRLVSELERRRRVTLLEGAWVTGVASAGTDHEISLADGRHLTARRVVVCTGPWLSETTRSWFGGRKVDARLKRVASLLIAEPPIEGASATYLFDDDAFFLPQPERSRWLFSFRAQQWDVSADGPAVLGAEDFARARGLLESWFPGGYPEPVGCRVFCDAYAGSNSPIVDMIRAGVAVAGAPGGSGVRLAPAMAERVLQLVEM